MTREGPEPRLKAGDSPGPSQIFPTIVSHGPRHKAIWNSTSPTGYMEGLEKLLTFLSEYQ